MTCSTLRKDFPFFNRHPSAYLDNAATSHKPQVMIDAMQQFYGHDYATVHRGLYPTGEQATTAYERSRTTIAQFINASPHDIIFTKGTTESINLVATAWGLQHCSAGDEIVLTMAEHHANLLPWQMVAQETGAKLVFIPVNPTTFMLENPAAYFSKKTKFAALTLSSNVLGDIWPTGALAECIARAQNVGAKVLIDAAQAVAHQEIDAKILGADFIAFSGHKLFGPTGVGVLYATAEAQNSMQPYQRGGSMVYEAHFDTAIWQTGPHKFEAGTPPIAQVIGLAASIEYLSENISWQAVGTHEAALCKQLIDGLNTIPGVTIVGNQEMIALHGHLVSFVVNGIHAHDIASNLGTQGVTVRAGHLCAQPLVTTLGHASLIRASVAFYTSSDDVALFVKALHSTISFFNDLLGKP
jgi:cysteine desulfurase/selenocysteine lyase